MKTGIELIAEERQRQIEEENWTAEHDSQFVCGELTDAAIMYAMRGYWKDRLPIEYVGTKETPGFIWPFSPKWWKPSENRIRDLQKAGALIAAEIDRLLNS